MPKKNLLISAALTAFILVIATGIASAYQRVNASIEAVKAKETAAARVDVVEQTQPTAAIPIATDEIQITLTHQEAALVAANFLEQTDLYSVENDVWEGIDAYKVVFSTGDIVYVSMYGDILATEEPGVVIITETTTNNNNNGSQGNNNSSNHDDDHNDDHDDDHNDDHDEDEHEEYEEHDDD